ncbi:STAS domain-containing protein [Pseudoduganella armeniaca]|uniref:STAS domain-containing protein n=1 Tax=Pseudoduganella armeniaca TaxID=2072590 RepID=A0A2R4CG92_9BURK|nr:STAS domain-containing protein [Pseudoduganella armeniaca]AVR98636.1 hypothetical protein C9I28_25630 [Pseudoduganella armeniaca]
MTMAIQDGTLACAGALTVEEAETLLQMIQTDGVVAVDLAGCEQVHAACLQVLMAARLPIAGWPLNNELARWLRAALHFQGA